MKIKLPENISEITLGQYMKYDELLKEDLDDLERVYRTVNIFTNLNMEQVKGIEYKDLIEVVNQITNALNEDSKFQHRFYIDDVEFGFVTLDKIKGKEYIDLINYTKNLEEVNNYHRLMAILFRPIINKSYNATYEIAEYSGTSEWCEIMKRTPMSVVNGSLSFFLNLQNELQVHILKYIQAEQVRDKQVQTTSTSGDG